MPNRDITYFSVRNRGTDADPSHISLEALKTRLWPKRLLKLQSVRSDELRIDIDPISEQWYLPIMTILAALSGAKRITVRTQDGIDRIPRWRAVGAAVSIVQALLAGWASLIRATVAIQKIERHRTLDTRRPSGTSILYVSTLEPGIGGALSHTTGLINGLRMNGTELVYLADTPNSYLDPTIPQISRAHGARAWFPGETHLYRRQSDILALAGKKASREQSMIVYHRLTLGGYAGAAIANRFRSFLIIEYNGSEVDIALKFSNGLKFLKLARRTENACLARADLIVTVSAVLRDELIDRGHDASKILCHPNGVDTGFFDPSNFEAATRSEIRTALKIPDDAVLGVFIGTFSPWHGTPTIAKALNGLSGNSKLHILFIGDGGEKNAVVNILAQGGGENRATFVGRTPPNDVPRFMMAADFALSPNVMPNSDERFFGSPTKLFEYLAMGLPIVASDLDGIRDVVSGADPCASDSLSAQQEDENGCGLLVRSGDPDHLLEAMQILEKDTAWRKTVAKRARDTAVGKYTWSHLAKAILDRIET